MPPTGRDYDVAISFVNEDLTIARALADRLGESFKVFMYADRQEEIAGTDGMVTFPDVFARQASLVVVLLRERWGQTKWTRVEMEAIKTRCFDEGWDALFPIAMDEATPPVWLLPTLIRFSMKDFGTDQAAGAIKARAMELGSKIERPSPIFLALRSQERAKFSEQRRQFLRTPEGVKLADAEAKRLINLITAKVREIEQGGALGDTEFGTNENRAVLRTTGVALDVNYRNYIVNVLDEAKLMIEESSGALLPDRGDRFLREPTSYGVSEYKPDVSQDLGWCWRQADGTLRPSESLADEAIARFFALRDRHSAGTLPRRRE